MKKSVQIVLSAVLAFSLALFISACSGGGGGSSSGGSSSITSLSTTTQGAQTAAASVSSARSVASSGVQLSSLVNSGSGFAPAFRAFAGTNMKTTAVSKFVARFSPVMKKAQVMRTSAMGYPMAISCSSSASGTVPNYSNDSMTIDKDASSGNMTLTFTQCADTTTYQLTDGVMTISGGATSSGTFAIGSNTRPFIVADYTPSSGMTTTTDMSQVNATMSTSTSATGDTMSITGSFEDWDYVLHSHDKQTMTNLSVNSASTTAMISNATYSVYTLAIDGSESGTTYVSDTSPTVNYSENDSFSGFSVADKIPVSGTGNDYLSINGTFSISTTPANKCIDGTFSIVTNTDIAIDSTGQTQSGQMTINSNVVVIFQPYGAVSVSVNGGTPQPFTLQELDSVCAL